MGLALGGLAAPHTARAQQASGALPAPQPGAHAGTRQAPLDSLLPDLRQPSPWLAPDHWAADALRRLHAAGIDPLGLDPGTRTPRLVEAAAVFAWTEAHAEDARLRATAAGWLRLLREEYGNTPLTTAAAPGPSRTPAFLAAGAGATAALAEGRVGTGVGYDEPPIAWSGTVALEDETHAGAAVDLHGALGTVAGLEADVETQNEEIAVRAAYGIVRAGPLVLWGGRRPVGFGPGRSGAITIGDGHAIDGGGLQLARPMRLPWVLRHLGPFHAELLASRVENGDSTGVRDPWLAGLRIAFSPHPRLDLGATRTVMFGGDNAAPFTWSRFTQMLLGDPSVDGGGVGAWSNEVFAWNAYWRPPLGRLPLALYLEHGFDDASGAYWRVPGIVAGIEVPFVPGLPALGLGVEAVYFGESSEKNGIWYRNYSLRGGWTHERRALGHPLGGHGRGLYGHVSLEPAGPRLRLQAATWLIERGAENLYAPEREGLAAGTALRAHWRMLPHLEMSAGATHEDGAGWQETTARLRLRYSFGRLR